MAAGLAQAQEGFKNLHTRAVEALRCDHIADLPFRAFEQFLVDQILVFAEGVVCDALYFFRQVFGHFALETAQQERMEFAAQLQLSEFAVGPAAADRQFVVFAERFMVAEIAGHQEVHDRPEVGDAVFDRRTGEHQFLQCADFFGRDRVLRGAVFDVLGLVEHGNRKFVLQIFIEVAAQQRIGGDDQVAFSHFFPVIMTIRPVHFQRAQPRRKFFSLFGPVVHEAGRADNQRRFAACFFAEPLQLKPDERLYRFPQTHFVGQDAAEAAALEITKPVNTVLLIRTERLFQFFAERFGFDFGIAVLGFCFVQPVG